MYVHQRNDNNNKNNNNVEYMTVGNAGYSTISNRPTIANGMPSAR
jgi:hypothetical protein